MSRSPMLVRLKDLDFPVWTALGRALRKDGTLSYDDVQCILSSIVNGDGVTYCEFGNVQTVLRAARNSDARAKRLIQRFLDLSYVMFMLSQCKRRTFNLPYTKDHIPSDTPHSRRPGYSMAALYLTIHSTGNPQSTARNERGWLTNKSNTRTASFHVVVDEKEAIECVPLDEVAWHAGDGSQGTGNRKSIGMEICESGDRAKTLANAISLAAKLLRDRGWDSSKLRRHKDWKSKECPRILISSAHRAQTHQTWEWFKKEVGKQV